MSFEIKFTMERPDTTTDFWWESTDPQIVDICHKIDTLAGNLGITRTSSKSDNNLKYESRFVFAVGEDWQQYMNAVIAEMPNMIEQRDTYLLAAGHTIHMAINHIESSSLIKETTAPTWVLTN